MQAFIPFSTMLRVWEAEDAGEKTISVSDTSFANWKKKWDNYNYKFNVLLPMCVDLNNKGVEYEKQGNIKDTINTYEQNILPNSYPARHAYDRLLVLYRKQKDYKNELRVCQCAMNTFKSDKKYKNRICKIKSLLKK